MYANADYCPRHIVKDAMTAVSTGNYVVSQKVENMILSGRLFVS